VPCSGTVWRSRSRPSAVLCGGNVKGEREAPDLMQVKACREMAGPVAAAEARNQALFKESRLEAKGLPRMPRKRWSIQQQRSASGRR
jgi:hypothetical protein